jgi:hypothetical protein
MTPKEKAEELVEKYSIKVEVYFLEDSIPRIVNAKIRLESAKQCALIAVDEMIKQQQIQFDEMVWSCVGYWKDVKQEIINL